jgi:hypothetical protein
MTPADPIRLTQSEVAAVLLRVGFTPAELERERANVPVGTVDSEVLHAALHDRPPRRMAGRP